MSKNIRKLYTVIIVLVLALASCASSTKLVVTQLPSTDSPNYESSFTLDAITTVENERDSYANRIAVLDAEFAANTPEPDGSTASMMAYAEAYLELWQGEVEALLTAKPSLADDFAAFESELQKELDTLAAQYQSDGGEIYGSAVNYELTWHRATALRDWLTDYYS